ncbi:hypothetical protein C2I36_13525 [Rhodobacteraceae bacterium WD3A24]|nr:hypothetical protein C2I36_13525 [Rhodobacteraceae bacterium WD3A24]
MSKRVVAFVLALAALGGAPAAAQPLDPCTALDRPWAEAARALTGRWQVHNDAGAATVRGMTMPMGPQPPVDSEITFDGEILQLTTLGADMEGPFTLQRADDGPDWNLTPGPQAQVTEAMRERMLDDEELGVVIGCAANEVPRLQVNTTFMFEGVTLDMTVHLFVLGDDLMYGAGVWRGGGVVGRRIVRLTRDGGAS